LIKTFITILFCLFSLPVFAQPLTLVVGFSPGGSSDLFARLVAEHLTENTNRKVVVQNVAGAGGLIAHTKIAKGVADGSVILLGSVGPLSVSPTVIDTPYDSLEDFSFISMGAELPNILVVPKSLNVTTLKQFVELSKANKNISYGSSGIYSSTHVAGELLQKQAKIDLIHVPYKGGGLALIDVVASRISSAIISPFTAEPYLKTGELVALGVTGKTRLSMLPNVPTIAEQGYENFDATNWYAFVAHKDVPDNVLNTLNNDIKTVLKDPKIQEKLITHGLTVKYSSRETLKKHVSKELQISKQIFN
jgi:tripartite-type tricarboxylate transporter receptor subunit TctC